MIPTHKITQWYNDIKNNYVDNRILSFGIIICALATKKTAELRITSALWRESIADRYIPFTKDQQCGNCFHVFPPLWSGCSWWVPSSLPERLRDETIKRSSRTGGGAAFGRGMLATCPPWGYMKTVVCFGQTYCRAIINANVACSRIASKKMHIQSTEITNKVLQSTSLLSTYWINVSTIALCYLLPFVNKSFMSSPFLSLSYRRITNGLNVSHI